MDIVAQVNEKLRGLLPGALGIELVEITPERVRGQLTAAPELCTTGGILHGGAIMAFADTLGATATVANLPPGAGTTTIESKTNFLAPRPREAWSPESRPRCTAAARPWSGRRISRRRTAS